jgi:AcrR family transcriptional regulator
MVLADPSADGVRSRQFTAHGQDRRAEIIHAAQELVTTNGLGATRMTDIAEAAGVTKGLLYWYFESKDALVAEILRDARRRLRDAQREALANVDDPLEKIYVGTVAAMQFVLSNYRLYQLSEAPAPGAVRVLSQSTQVHARDATETIEEGQRRGVVRDNDPAAAIAYANGGVVNQLCSNAFYGNLRGGIDEIAHLGARYVVRGCAASAELAEAIERKYVALDAQSAT